MVSLSGEKVKKKNSGIFIKRNLSDQQDYKQTLYAEKIIKRIWEVTFLAVKFDAILVYITTSSLLESICMFF